MRKPFLPWIMSSLTALMLGGAVLGADVDPGALAEQAVAAVRKGDLPGGIALASKAIKAAPKEREGWLLRAQIYELQGDYGKAVADFSEVIKMEPKAADAWQQRGEAQFKAGKIAESIADFDEYLKLVPDQRAHHWQRGISLYYAGRFAGGRLQFELHQAGNKQDVENAVWHFLCTTRAESLDAARKKLIPITGDPRIPMAQVQQLFAGKATPADVLAAAKAGPARTSAGEPLFYAHLYLGIYFEATGENEKAREHILKAAERSKQNGYMGDVARVHADILRKKDAK
ncbi:MAG: tetratricopeptide repeat protein [Actinomycetota bacterium]